MALEPCQSLVPGVKSCVPAAQNNVDDARARFRDGSRRPAVITERDRDLLTFLSGHRFATRRQIERLLGIGERSAYRQLGSLAERGLVRFDRPLGRLPACYRITRRGLTVIESELSPPRPVELASYAHDLGVAWLDVAARRGAWGELREIVTERRMRSADASAGPLTGGDPLRPEPFGVRLHGFGRGGWERLHYPDLVLVDREERRIALELELTAKGRARRQRVLEAYAGDSRFAAVLYLVDRPDVARLIERSAERLGVAKIVHVQWFRAPAARTPGAEGRERSRPATPRATRRAGPAPGR